jgi:hypothetical protein
MEDCVALTQNFVTNSKKHLAQVLSFLTDKADQVSGFDKDVESPYDLFVERLREKHPQLLDEALEEVERKAGSKKRRWDEAIGTANEAGPSNGGFSFGFGGDDLDEDEIP